MSGVAARDGGKVRANNRECPLPLDMKPECERCEAGLDPAGEAWICSYECSYCGACARELESVCPNCGGELVRRPRRRDSAPR